MTKKKNLVGILEEIEEKYCTHKNKDKIQF